MHFSSAIVLAVIAALVSSSSAMPTTSDATRLPAHNPKCPSGSKCDTNPDCQVEGCTEFCGWVSHILDFTSVEYGR
ncbi:uncharacterized protein EDB93DRAFT_1113733 [Suillus bovinus]|uniref:uncharacterized protein n=1 Tax=Suillus bovinus TaxID=48563 RepID=UPI001B882B82|nr:uncharacterized protein EDB93DRAFT_1113733 [Suillus bovinus]KAG2160176.1 hypothetical protein EDB93DRAFT_1113733 [Suillus bovinus]